MKNLTLLLVGALSFGLFSCDSEETTSPQPQVGLEFKTIKTAAPLNGRVASTNSLAFTSGTIVLSQVRFEGENDGDSIEVEFEMEQDVTIDFATGQTSPNINGVGFKPGTYEEIEVEMELQDSGSKPAVVLNGTFTDREGKAHPVRFEFNSAETFEVEQEGNITFAEGQSAVALVTFKPTDWFARVSPAKLSAARKNAQGIIVISETQNADIFDIVADGLDLATEVEIKK